MDKNAIIKEYFSDRLRKRDGLAGYPFVTISRQAGAGGHTLAETLLRAINDSAWSDLLKNWRIFDRELCDIIARDPKLKVLVKSLLTEEYHSEIQEFFTALFGGPAHQHELYKKTFELIRMLGAMGKVIIVGRGAAFATHDLARGIRIRLIAPEPDRIRHMADYLKMDPTKARNLVRSQDRQRAKMVRDFFDKDIEEASLYDRVWDTSKISMEDMAAGVLRLIEEKAR